MAAGQSKKTTSKKVQNQKNKGKQATSTNTRKVSATKAKRNQTAKTRRRTNQQNYSNLIVVLCCAAIMIFMEACNVGMCGSVGAVVSDVLFGLFGIVQYIIPVAVVIAVIVLINDSYSSYVVRKVTYSVVFLLLLCALSHMLVHIDWGFEQLGDSFLYSSKNKTAGGIVGALITSIFYPFLDQGGTYLLIILSMVILFFMMAGTAVVQFFKGMHTYFEEDEQEMLAREEYLARRQERREVKKKERQIARRQYYREAAEKEQEQISELEQRRQQRMQQIEQRGVKNQNLFQTLQVLPQETAVETGSKKAKTQPQILKEEGFVGEEKAKKRKNTKTEEKKEQQAVQISANGELSIAEDAKEEYDLSKEQFLPEENNSLEEDVAEKGKQPEEKPVIETTTITAEFVPEEELEETYPLTIEGLTEKNDVARVEAQRTTESVKKDSHEKVEKQKNIAEPASVPEEKTGKEKQPQPSVKPYERPLLELLDRGKNVKSGSEAQLRATAKKLEDTLNSFGVHVKVTNISCGPAVTRYEMLPEQGTRVSKITNLTDDIKLSLAVADIRIEAPIPGKSAIGVEVPNKEASPVAFRDLLEDSDFLKQKSDLAFAVGKDIGGKVVISDIAKMPHVLIAGATGSGKSVCINTLIMSLLYKAHPDDVKLIMIDPKVVELSVYNGIPHLLIPVVTDPKKASGALNWAVAEMEARYKKFAEYNVRNLEGYNQKVQTLDQNGDNPEQEITRMPKIVIIVDELADLMMVAHNEVEDAIVRLSQLARAAGIHLVIATQRPSVDVITGLIKANVPSRIAFAVSSGVDSRTILDMNGAEKLLGKGDMLFAPSSYPKPIRVQGAFISDKEVGRVVEFLKAQQLNITYNDTITREINCGPQSVRQANKEQERDEYFMDAGRFIIEKDKASIGMLQRVYKIGFNRAARIMDQLAEAGVVGPEEGTKPRQILMSIEEFEEAVRKEE